MEQLHKLARLLLGHSLGLKAGELFEINSGVAAKPLIKALMKEASRIGAIPYVRLEDDELTRLSFAYIDPEHPEAAKSALEKNAAWEKERWKHLDAHVDIGVDENDAELSAIDPRALSIHRGAMREVRDIRINQRRWVYLHWPTMADAQKAGMPYDDFFGFFLNAVLVDYEQMRRSMEPLVQLMKASERVHILGRGTDLTFSIAGMNAVPCFGERNIPDGEVYTAPVRESANGVVTYNTTAQMFGRQYHNPR